MRIEYDKYFIQNIKGNPRMFEIGYSGRGGKLPNALHGQFTEARFAKQVIDRYISDPKRRNKNDSQTESAA